MELSRHKLEKLIFFQKKKFLYFRRELAKPKNNKKSHPEEISPKKVLPHILV